jgi:hypothetical protein
MPLYRCFVRGENFPGYLAMQKSPVGFYTTRWVNADSPEQAKLAVLELLKDDPSLRLRPGAPKPKRAKVYVEEVVRVTKRQGINKGFSFFSAK